MVRGFTFALVALAIFLSIPMNLLSSDLAKEKRWADQIVDALIEGEAQWLNAQGHEFLAIYTESVSENGKYGAIVLHGIGVHPDWPQVIYPLRVRLAEKGWATLSLQMPILPNEAEFSEYAPLLDEVAPRIQAGISFLRDQGIEKIVLVAHSLGATMATYYLAEHHSPVVVAFVGVGMSAGTGHVRLDSAVSIEKIGLPILDIYGSHDLQGVVNSSARRAAAAKKAGNKQYKQIKVQGADHFFDAKEDELIENVYTCS